MFKVEVLNPVAAVAGLRNPIDPAPRPSELRGQRIGLIWNAKANGDVFLDSVAALLRERGADVTRYNGAFPSPDDVFEQASRECQSFVIAVGDCGASSGWTAHDVFRFEQRRQPAVGIVGRDFSHDVEAMAKARGLVHSSFVEVPGGFTTRTADVLAEFAADALPDIIRLLTQAPPHFPESTVDHDGRLAFEADDPFRAFEDFQRLFMRNGWSDGFPLVPPTEDKVDAMMGKLRARHSAIVCVLPPGNGEATVQKLAINAVMAGCDPDHFPIVLAATKAISRMGDPGIRMGTSAGPLAPLIVVNGPGAHELGLNSGRCALGPGRESAVNVAIGRAVRLIMMNVGLCYPGGLDPDTIGSARKFSQCLAENESASPWEPLHVEKGVDKESTAVTVFCVWSESSGAAIWGTTAEEVLDSLAFEEARPGGWYLVQAFGGLERSDHGILVLLSPEHAAIVGGEGWTKKNIKQYLWQRSSVQASRLLHKWSAIKERIRPQWKWLLTLSRRELNELWLPSQESPDHFEVVVVGGAAPYDSMLGLFGAPVTVKVEEVYDSIA